MFKHDIRDYLGWWMSIPAILVVILQVPSCVQKQNEINLKTVQVMTEHCKSQGKTYMQYPQQTEGLCI